MTALLSGQISVTAVPQPLSSVKTEVSNWSLKAPLTNTHPVYVGAAAVMVTTGYQLDPGDVLEYELRNQTGMPVLAVQPSDVYVVGTAGGGDTVSWLASP